MGVLDLLWLWLWVVIVSCELWHDMTLWVLMWCEVEWEGFFIFIGKEENEPKCLKSKSNEVKVGELSLHSIYDDYRIIAIKQSPAESWVQEKRRQMTLVGGMKLWAVYLMYPQTDKAPTT